MKEDGMNNKQLAYVLALFDLIEELGSDELKEKAKALRIMLL